MRARSQSCDALKVSFRRDEESRRLSKCCAGHGIPRLWARNGTPTVSEHQDRQRRHGRRHLPIPRLWSTTEESGYVTRVVMPAIAGSSISTDIAGAIPVTAGV